MVLLSGGVGGFAWFLFYRNRLRHPEGRRQALEGRRVPSRNLPRSIAKAKRPDRDVALSTLGNVVWIIVAGWWLALLHLISGLILMITIIGIPLGVANIKRAGLAIAPYGKRIVSTKEFRSESPGDVTIVSVIKTDR